MNAQDLLNNLLNTYQIYQRIITDFANMEIQVLRITVGSIVLIILTALVALQVIKFLKYRVLKAINHFAEKHKLKVLDLVVDQLAHIGNPFFISATLFFIGNTFEPLNEINRSIFFPIFVMICGFYSISIIKSLLLWFITATLVNAESPEEEKTDEAFIQMVQTITGIMTYIIVLIGVGQILNWNLTAIISVLGVSSIAIGFAMQNILTDIFAAFTIYVDQPFKPGDQIIIDNFTGTVKKIGLKSTRVSLLDGDELIVSNRDLTSARVRNLRKITARKVSVKVLLSPQITVDKIKKAREIIVESVNSTENVNLVRINFIKFDAFGKDIEYVFLIENQDYEIYVQIQEEINFKIITEFEKNQIELSTQH